jgi:hypothetical protein
MPDDETVMAELGLLRPDVVLVHMVQITPEHARLVAAGGASIAHCSPARAAAAAATSATAVFPVPTSPCRRRSIGSPATRSVKMASIAAA